MPDPNQHIRDKLTSLEKLKPVTMSAAQKAAVESAIRRSVKDPESLRFGMFVAGKSADGQVTVCGLFNAKNSFGGYVGNSAFMGTVSSGAKPTFDFAPWWTGASDDHKSALITCDAHGLRLSA